MSKIASQLDAYIEAYDRYQSRSAEIESAHTEAVQTRQKLQYTQNQITAETRTKSDASILYDGAKKTLDEFKQNHSSELVTQPIDEELHKFEVSFESSNSTGLPWEYLSAKREYEQAITATDISREFDAVFPSQNLRKNAGAQASRNSGSDLVNLLDEDTYSTICSQISEEIDSAQNESLKSAKVKSEKKKAAIQDKIEHTSALEYCVAQFEDDSHFREIMQKKDELDVYFSALSKYGKKYSAISPKTLSAEQLNQEYCACSMSQLHEKIAVLTDVSSLPTKIDGKTAHKAAKDSGAVSLILIIFAIGVFGCMIYNFHGIFNIPATAISGFLSWVIRLAITIFITVVVATVMFAISSAFGGGLATVVAVIATVIAFLFALSYTGNIFSVQNLLGFGTAISTGFGLFLEIPFFILVAVMFSVVPRILLVYTPISRLFCGKTPITDGYKTIESDYEANTMAYVCLYHLPEAVRGVLNYSYNQELAALDKQCTEEMTQIKLQYKRKIEKKLAELGTLRTKQAKAFSVVQQKQEGVERAKLNAIAKKRAELSSAENARVKSLKDRQRSLENRFIECRNRLNSSNQKLAALERERTRLETDCERKSAHEDELKKAVVSERKHLEELSGKMVQGRESLNTYFVENSTLTDLLACEGTLNRNLYYVKNQLDAHKMAIVKKFPMTGKPTVFLYDNSHMTGNNLSEELCSAVDWIYTTIKRSNNLYLIHRLSIVDVVSGQNVFLYAPYKQEMSVFANDAEKKELGSFFNERADAVRSECNSDRICRIRTVNNIDELNQVKMTMNREDIQQYPDITYSELMQKPTDYCFIIYIIPPVVENVIQPSVFTEDLKLAVKGGQRSGLIPMFLVDKRTWGSAKNSDDVAFIQSIQDKDIYEILNADAHDGGNTLDIKSL